jgi:hypothetical protein
MAGPADENPMWGDVGDVDPEMVYPQSFAKMANQTKYEDGMNGIFTVRKGKNLWYNDPYFSKAVNLGAADGAAGFALTPVVYDTEVIDITRRLTPVMGLIPKVTNQGTTANYYRITERGAAAWGPEDPALNEADDKKAARHEDIKFLRITGRVTGPAQAGGAHFESAMQREVINKTMSMNEAIEEELLVGTNTAAYGHDGLQQMLTSNDTDMNGADPTLADIKKLVSTCWLAKGHPNLIITDPLTRDKLELQMLDYTRTAPTISFAWGLETLAIQTSIGVLPILASQFMPYGADEKRLFVVDTNHLQQRVLVDTTFTKLGIQSDSEKFFMKGDGTAVRNSVTEG